MIRNEDNLNPAHIYKYSANLIFNIHSVTKKSICYNLKYLVK